uniref:RB binding protein 5, histone lysine methyltransferase complex subunit n=1 Tax=Latimeria chalumnae TaxID=7897 RepID=H3AYS0_LATCH
MNLELLESFGQNYPEEADGTLDCISMALTCTFNRWGTLLAVGCNDGRIVIWDFLTRGIAKIISAHIHPVCSLCMRLCTDLCSGPDVAVLDCYWPGIEYSKLIAKLTLVSGDCELYTTRCIVKFFFFFFFKILVLKTDTQDLVASFRVTTGTSNTTAIKSIEFARKGSCFLINTADRIIRVYDGREILTCGRDGEPEPMQKLQDLVNRTPWKKCCFSGDGEYIVAGSARQHALYIWEKSIGNLVKILHGTRGELLLDVAWHPVRPIIASISSGVVSIWAQNQVENWSAFAPDFKELDENVEYEERESEFDIEDEDKSEPEQTGADAAEDEEVDVTSVDPIAAFCSSTVKLVTEWLIRQAPVMPVYFTETKMSLAPPPKKKKINYFDYLVNEPILRLLESTQVFYPTPWIRVPLLLRSRVLIQKVHPLLGVKGDGKSKKKQAGRPKGSKGKEKDWPFKAKVHKGERVIPLEGAVKGKVQAEVGQPQTGGSAISELL